MIAHLRDPLRILENEKRANEQHYAISSIENDEWENWDGLNTQPVVTHLGKLLTVVCKSKHLIRYRFTNEPRYTDELDCI